MNDSRVSFSVISYRISHVVTFPTYFYPQKIFFIGSRDQRFLSFFFLFHKIETCIQGMQTEADAFFFKIEP